MKKQFITIFIISFLIVLLVGSCSMMFMNSTAVEALMADYSEQAQEEQEVDQPEQAEESGIVSYSFVGKIEGITDRRTEEKEKEQPDVEDNPQLDGVIPELTIELNGMDIRQIARHYGYVLALMTNDRLLGPVENGELKQLTAGFMENYAPRARAADIPAEYLPLVNRLQSHLNQTIRAVYLVPNHVEEKFIDIQMQAIRDAGMKPEQVVLVRAKYLSDYSIEVIEIET